MSTREIPFGWDKRVPRPCCLPAPLALSPWDSGTYNRSDSADHRRPFGFRK